MNVQGGGTNVVGSQHVTVNIGYTIEQHEQRLRAREQELREAFQATLGQSEERRHTIERELQGVQSQLGNLQNSYEERVAELKRLAGELEALRGQVPDAKLREALDALAQGRTRLADALLAEVKDPPAHGRREGNLYRQKSKEFAASNKLTRAILNADEDRPEKQLAEASTLISAYVPGL